MAGNSTLLIPEGEYRYPPNYVDTVFLIWYKNGRVGRSSLHNLIPEDEFGRKPHSGTLQTWIDSEEWIRKADELDKEVARRLEEQMVTEKMQMLQRHAEIGLKAQEIALRFLEENEDEITPSSAVRLLVDGVRIERDSRGLSNLLDEISKMSDEKLLEQLKKTVEGKEFDIEQIEVEP